MGYILEGKSKFQGDIDKLVESQNIVLLTNESALNSQNSVDSIIKKDKTEKETILSSIEKEKNLQEKTDCIVNSQKETYTDNQLLNEILMRKKEIIMALSKLVLKGIKETKDPLFFTDGRTVQPLTYKIVCAEKCDTGIAEMYLSSLLTREANFVTNSEYNVNIQKVEYVKKGNNLYTKNEYYLIEIILKMKTKNKSQKL